MQIHSETWIFSVVILFMLSKLNANLATLRRPLEANLFYMTYVEVQVFCRSVVLLLMDALVAKLTAENDRANLKR